MLQLYDYLDEVLSVNKIRPNNSHAKLKYYGSELMEKLDYKDQDEFKVSIERAIKACHSLNVPVKSNFKEVYRYKEEGLTKDWLLSQLGCYLVIINGNPANANVAKAQLMFAMNSKDF